MATNLQSLCGVCHIREPKYTCPACALKTCSVGCVQRHKTQTGCRGEVDPTTYASRSEIAAQPLILNRDYNFLQRISRTVDVSKQDQTLKKRQRNDHVLNGVNIKTLPPKMHRAAINKSGYNPRRKKFFWTVEFVVVDGDREETMVKSFVTDALTVKEAVAMVNDASDLQVFLRKIDLPANEPGAIRLDLDSTLKDALKGRTVLEFPTFYVVVNGSTPKFDIYTLQSSSDESTSESDDDGDNDSNSDDEHDKGKINDTNNLEHTNDTVYNE